MNALPVKTIRVLAIDPTTSGFGFAVMEGPEQLVDWGVREASGDDKNPECLKLISELVDRYRPDVLVTENIKAKGSRRCNRVRELIESARTLSGRRRLPTRQVTRVQVREVFGQLGASTKHEIATAIVKRLPELAPRLPRYRQPWMSEDSRMAIFDAVAIALTFYDLRLARRKDLLSASGINNHVQEQESSRSSH